MSVWAAALSLAAFAATASAASGTFVESYLASDFQPRATATVTANGYWSAGTSNGMPTVVRYAADGSATLTGAGLLYAG